MWNTIRLTPEINKPLLIHSDKGGFVLTTLRKVEDWAHYINQGGTRWLYCDDLVDTGNPNEFNIDFVRRLTKDCEYAAKQFRDYPSKRACFKHAAETMSMLWMSLSQCFYDMEGKVKK